MWKRVLRWMRFDVVLVGAIVSLLSLAPTFTLAELVLRRDHSAPSQSESIERPTNDDCFKRLRARGKSISSQALRYIEGPLHDYGHPDHEYATALWDYLYLHPDDSGKIIVMFNSGQPFRGIGGSAMVSLEQEHVDFSDTCLRPFSK
jgi:hypothetical protein